MHDIIPFRLSILHDIIPVQLGSSQRFLRFCETENNPVVHSEPQLAIEGAISALHSIYNWGFECKPGLFLGRRQIQCKNGTKSQTTAIFQVGPEIPVLASLQRVGVSIVPQSTRIGAVWEGVLYARLVGEIRLIEGLALRGVYHSYR